MRKNIAKVIAAFKAGKSIKGDSKGTCWTNGEDIYSYRMKIARKWLGSVQVIDRDCGPSMTTRMQISAIKLSFPEAEIVQGF